MAQKLTLIEILSCQLSLRESEWEGGKAWWRGRHKLYLLSLDACRAAILGVVATNILFDSVEIKLSGAPWGEGLSVGVSSSLALVTQLISSIVTNNKWKITVNLLVYIIAPLRRRLLLFLKLIYRWVEGGELMSWNLELWLRSGANREWESQMIILCKWRGGDGTAKKSSTRCLLFVFVAEQFSFSELVTSSASFNSDEN